MIEQRLASQLLTGPPASDPVTVTRRLLAIQGQDARGARLAIRARSTGLNVADVDSALTEQRSLVISWLCRGTLHLVASEDYHWLHALSTPPLFTAARRRLAAEGVSPGTADRALEAVNRSLIAEGPLTRAQLAERVASAGVPAAGDTHLAIMFLAGVEGIALRGPIVNGQHAYVSVRDWLGPPPPPRDRGPALAELARRYLAGHAPAHERDLVRWSGLPLRDARAGLMAIAGELADRGDGLLSLRRRLPASELPPPRLLGAFEPLLVGWGSRAFIAGSQRCGAHQKRDLPAVRPGTRRGRRDLETRSLLGAVGAVCADRRR